MRNTREVFVVERAFACIRDRRAPQQKLGDRGEAARVGDAYLRDPDGNLIEISQYI